MVNEIRLRTTLRLTNGGLVDKPSNAQHSIDQTTQGMQSVVRTAVVAPGSIYTFAPVLVAAGICYVENLDATNAIGILGVTTATLMQIKPGESYAFRLDPGETGLFIEAVAGTPKIEVRVYED